MERAYLSDLAMYIVLKMVIRPNERYIYFENNVYRRLRLVCSSLLRAGCIRINGERAEDAPAGTPWKVVVECRDRTKLEHFVEIYLKMYQTDMLRAPTYTYYSYTNSMRATLKLLREYANINEKVFNIIPKFKDGERVLQVNKATRMQEDLLILARKGFIKLDSIKMIHVPALLADLEKEGIFPVSIAISFLTTVDYMEKMLSTSQSYLGLSVSDDNEVYFEGKRISQFTSNAKKQIGLLRLLIAMQGVPVSKETVYKELKYTSKTKKAPKNEMCLDRDKKGPKSGVKKRYQERLKKLIKPIVSKLPESLKIMNTAKEGVWLQLGETEVSQ